MPKYICNRGEFRCKYCGTVYLYSDLRDICEGRPWYKAVVEQDQKHVLDHLNLNIGDPVLCTMYYGNDYAREPKKAGIKLVWFWSFIRDRRIIPNGANIMWHGAYFRHYVEYKIGSSLHNDKIFELLGDRWDLTNGSSNYSILGPFGPRHIWTLDLLREFIPNINENNWTQIVFSYCAGPRTKGTLKKLIDAGYDISDSVLVDLPDEISECIPEKRNVY